jgi:glucosamine--fructose-6-phosphate aminotransferase (isomerizing)
LLDLTLEHRYRSFEHKDGRRDAHTPNLRNRMVERLQAAAHASQEEADHDRPLGSWTGLRRMSATPTTATPYLNDILDQPQCLRTLLRRRPWEAITPLSGPIRDHNRIVLTGMGASLFALWPAWLTLVSSGRAVWLVETAQLLHDLPELVTERTLVLAASQSGRSAEIVALAEQRRGRAALVGVTNDGSSPLAQSADVAIDIESGEEHAVSTRSYVNTLAAATLAAERLTGRTASEGSFAEAAEAIATYLDSWRERVDEIKEQLGLPERLYFLARGASLAGASCGALILKEAAKWPAEAMSSGQFRHGPLELADSRMTAVVLAGDNDRDRKRNRRLLEDIERYGGQGIWADAAVETSGATLRIPGAKGAGRNIAEIVTLQLLSIAIAEQTGIEAGVFRHLEKVTTVE